MLAAMKKKIILTTLLFVFFSLLLVSCQKRAAVFVDIVDISPPEKDYSRPLPPGELALRKITDPAEIPDYTLACSDLEGLAQAIDNSLNYMAKPSSQRFYPYGDISHEQAVTTLKELKKLVTSGMSPAEMNKALREEFDTYISVGCDGAGTVLFTGYYTPVFEGSPERTERFRYPLYKTPDDLIKDEDGVVLGRKGPAGGVTQYPPRKEMEASRMLDGLEIVWLADQFEVYIVQVQGSAKIRMPDGHIETIHYDAHNGHDYKSIVPQMVADGRISSKNISLKKMIDYFRGHPDQVGMYVNHNPRFVFFKRGTGEPRGSINEPVTPFKTIATDKAIYPRAMFTFAAVDLKKPVGFALDQDTGGAIRAAGRCDVYKGVGDEAGELAGQTYREGRLYYLFIKPDSTID
jgi:membrane-bound lytic murein transglycosylase A